MDEASARIDGLSRSGSLLFDDFYLSNASRIRRTLSVIIGDHDLAREATDVAMTKAYERWNRLSRSENPAGWVYRVGLNWAKRQMRRRSYDITPLAAPTRTGEPAIPDPSLWKALDGLSSDHRTVVVLRYSEDWSVAQIAEALDIPPGTVKSRLHRALKQLREELE